MRCSGCGAENPDAAKFCNRCGSALAAGCARCGHPNPHASRFCSECGTPLAAPAQEPHFASPQSYTPRSLAEKILSDRFAIEGERKQVTVLFADVAGFTPLAATLDPEESYALMRRCLDLMLEEVHRYEGTVTQFLGDGILALFGAPIAHEDHAQRAVRAALGIQHALRAYRHELQQGRAILFRMRIGLNSGLVVVGSIGTDLSMTYTAIGDTVNLGDRVRSLAEPGTVVISENTYRLVSGYFTTRELGEHPVKGKDEPVTAYEVLRPRRWRSRVDAYAERGLTPLVGREAELAMLLERYEMAREGRGQIAFVRGEAGIGKSRLLYEFKRRLEAEERTWLEGRCISFGGDIAYFPLSDLLKDRFEIEETDPEPEIARKVEAGARRLGSGLAGSEPFLKHLLAVDAADEAQECGGAPPGPVPVAALDPGMRKVRTFEALRDLLIAEAAVRPLEVLVEDLHWIDPLSEQFLLWLAEAAPDHPLLLVLTARRGYDQRFLPLTSSTLIDVQNLSGPESAAVAQGLLGAELLPAELEELIHRKAEGNPFFVEEVTKSLLEAGAIRRSGSGYVLAQRVEEIFVPDTVQDVIMARLDRLPEEPKRALQTASVIGREFTVRLLERTAELPDRIEACLRELQTVELIYERALYPELAFMFKHALTHNAAYSSLLVARRKVLHRLVGAAIEELYSDRLPEQYETLAYHYEQGEAWEKAREYLQKSGDKARAAFAPQQALTFYDRVLAGLEKPGQTLAPERMIALHHGRGEALFQTSQWDESAASFQAMWEAALGAGDRVQEGVALAYTAQVYFQAHCFEVARDFAERAHDVAVSTNDAATLAGSLAIKGMIAAVTGDLPNARTAIGEALAAARQGGGPFVEAGSLHFAGLLDHWRGDHTRALERLDEGVRIGRQHQITLWLLGNLFAKGLAHCGHGEYEPALRCLKEGVELSGRVGDQFFRCRLLNTIGWVYMDLCHWELALQYNGQAATEARALGDPETIRNAELNLADCCLDLGRLDEAQRTLETIHQESQRRGVWGEEWMKWRYTQRLNASTGDLWLARGDPETALAVADACLAVAEATGSRRNIVKGRRVKGEAFLALGKLDEADTELEEAVLVAREVGNPAQIWKTLAVMGRLRQAQRRPEDARAASEGALATIEGVAAGLSDVALRDVLLASPQAAALREAAGQR